MLAPSAAFLLSKPAVAPAVVRQGLHTDEPFSNPDHDLLVRVARGEEGERTPVWLMRQAGRYMADFRKYSDTIPFRERSETPDIAVELSLQCWRAYGMDGVIMFSDILTPLPAMGIEFDVIKGKGPVISNPPRDMAAVKAMKPLAVRMRQTALILHSTMHSSPMTTSIGSPQGVAVFDSMKLMKSVQITKIVSITTKTKQTLPLVTWELTYPFVPSSFLALPCTRIRPHHCLSPAKRSDGCGKKPRAVARWWGLWALLSRSRRTRSTARRTKTAWKPRPSCTNRRRCCTRSWTI